MKKIRIAVFVALLVAAIGGAYSQDSRGAKPITCVDGVCTFREADFKPALMRALHDAYMKGVQDGEDAAMKFVCARRAT